MSGILDKKSRIIDFIITENGRSQIEDGDIRYKFATFSDSSIIYTKDHELSKTNKSEISASEIDYIPLEASSKVNSNINPEFDLGKFFTYTNSNILDSSKVKNSINFNASVDNFLTNQTLSSSLKNLNLITTENLINSDKQISFANNGYLNYEIDFQGKSNKYSTIETYKKDKKNIPVIALDKRFSNKINYKMMIPKDISGEELYEKSQFKNINNLDDFNTTGYVYSSYNVEKNAIANQSDLVLSREKEILKTIKAIEKDESIHKKIYQLENNSDENTFIFELHEARIETNDIEKLSFVKLGSFFDKENSSTKHVYLIGKVVNSREDSSDLDVLFNFNNGKINLKNKSKFAISAYYSFVTLFTLVVE
jgi:hypothetical protein